MIAQRLSLRKAQQVNQVQVSVESVSLYSNSPEKGNNQLLSLDVAKITGQIDIPCLGYK